MQVLENLLLSESGEKTVKNAESDSENTILKCYNQGGLIFI